MARCKASDALGRPTGDEEIVVIPRCTVEKPYGWYFIYNTRAFAETGNFERMLVGNGPILVLKDGSSIDMFPSAYSVETAIQAYENKRRP